MLEISYEKTDGKEENLSEFRLQNCQTHQQKRRYLFKDIFSDKQVNYDNDNINQTEGQLYSYSEEEDEEFVDNDHLFEPVIEDEDCDSMNLVTQVEDILDRSLVKTNWYLYMENRGIKEVKEARRMQMD